MQSYFRYIFNSKLFYIYFEFKFNFSYLILIWKLTFEYFLSFAFIRNYLLKFGHFTRILKNLIQNHFLILYWNSKLFHINIWKCACIYLKKNHIWNLNWSKRCMLLWDCFTLRYFFKIENIMLSETFHPKPNRCVQIVNPKALLKW